MHPILELYPRVKTFGPGEHPFPTRYATRLLTMFIELNRYLNALEPDVLEASRAGSSRGSFGSAEELLAVDEPLIMNCTGLGAKDLTFYTVLEPVRGQLSVLPPPARRRLHITLHGSRYMFPCMDGIVLGGTFEHGNANLAIDPRKSRDRRRTTAAFFTAMRSR